MDAVLQRVALLARAEGLAIRIQAKHAARSAALTAAALAAAMLAFGMLNLCGYTVLAAAYGQTTAALVLAVVDALLALILLVQARKQTPTSEEAMVDELRALALAGLANDTARVKAQLVHLQHQVTHIGESISLAKSDPLHFGLANIGPILSLASRLLSRNKDG
jgi:hypothetical protein